MTLSLATLAVVAPRRSWRGRPAMPRNCCGWRVEFFTRLFKKNPNINYQIVNWLVDILCSVCFVTYVICLVYVFRKENQWAGVVFSEFESGVRNESPWNPCIEQITSSHFFPAWTKLFFPHHALRSLRVTKSPDRLRLTQYKLYCMKLSHLWSETKLNFWTWQIARLLWFNLIYYWESTLLLVFAEWTVQTDWFTLA